MEYNNVLTFWFGSLDSPKWNMQMQTLWFDDKMSADEQCKIFLPEVSAAGEGKLADWLDSPLGALAHIILLDQCPRRIYRGFAAAYRYDEFALALCKKGLAKGQDQQLMPVQRAFFYMPLLHSEYLEDQEESCFLFKQLCNSAMPEQQALFTHFYQLARCHFLTIKRFTRFPERNAMLGRLSTQHELRWLKDNLAME